MKLLHEKIEESNAGQSRLFQQKILEMQKSLTTSEAKLVSSQEELNAATEEKINLKQNSAGSLLFTYFA